MKFKPANPAARAHNAFRAFTLAEVLAAMMFMAIVIPVAMQGLRIASLAGEVGQRKIVAARIGNKIMNELKVTGQLQNSSQSGVVTEGGLPYKWSVRNQRLDGGHDQPDDPGHVDCHLSGAGQKLQCGVEHPFTPGESDEFLTSILLLIVILISPEED